MKINKTISTMGAALAMSLADSYAVDVNVTANITTDTVWTSDNAYILSEPIFVKNGASLTIEPGTQVFGAVDDMGTPADDTDDTFGSLIITRGSQIFAEGTCEKPIVFTSIAERDGIDPGDGSNIIPTPELGFAGLWGGLIILGEAPINNFQGGTNLNEADIEGFPAGATTDIQYGGNDPNDNSGVLRFVSIRFGGFEFAPGEEINGLTLGGVGDGTQIEYVEVVANSDDGIEFFGGTVNTRYMVAAFCQDESFDIDQGHQGTHQYWFAIQNQAGDNGTEADGGDGETFTGLPLTTAKVYNATYIGGTAAAGSGNDAFRMRQNFAGQFHNSVFHDFGGQAIRVDSGDTTIAAQLGVNLFFQNNTFGTFAGGATHNGSTIELDILNDTGNVGIGTDPLLRGISRIANNGLDPRPAANSPLWSIPEGTGLTDLAGTSTTTGLSVIAAADQNILTNTVYRGAFGLSNWLDKWTYLSNNNYLATSGSSATAPTAVAARNEVMVSGTITDTTVWTADSNYILTEPIFVNQDATLLIEPGVQIFGNGQRLVGAADGGVDDTNFGSLVITRGSKLVAEGTCDQPIVFTARDVLEVALGASGDPGAFLPTPAFGAAGLWGGLIILGEAPINNFQGGTNLNEADIEGFPAGVSSDIQYGGTDVNDYSGNLRFVSIQFGGFEFAPGDEINGLTLGGVGNATGVEYVEVVSNSDDGIEFFGGTVNTKRLVAAFCQDESFDIDQGHQGCHQYWLAIQDTAGDNATEADGGDGETFTGLPLTTAKVYNATYIGGGSADGTNNDAFRMRQNFAGQFHNSIFHDFGGQAIRVDSGDTTIAAQFGVNLFFQNNIFGAFAGGATHNGSTIEMDILTDVGNSPIGTDPQLRGIDRANGEYDLRPFMGSPAFTTALTAVDPADEGCFFNANYRGAFGMANWAECWTYLDTNSFFVDIEAVVESADYITWRGTELVGETALVSPFEDFNEDGLGNFVSYAFGLDPQDIADRSGLPTVTDPATGAVTYTRRDTALTGLAYNVFIAADLNFSATPATPGVDYTQIVTPIGGTDNETVVITPTSVGTPIFLKVVAE